MTLAWSNNHTAMGYDLLDIVAVVCNQTSLPAFAFRAFFPVPFAFLLIRLPKLIFFFPLPFQLIIVFFLVHLLVLLVSI